VIKVAALYVEPGGPYYTMADVEPWGLERDARRYGGPHPVIAHPPCGPWGELRHLYRGDEHDCAPAAIAATRAWGGVLEHPHKSRFWATVGVPPPGDPPDRFGGWTIDVDQVSWGHVARKRTRLYFVGVERDLVISTMRTGGTPTHWVCGTKKPNAGGGSLPAGMKFCSSAQRRRTPRPFGEWLRDLAMTACV
jgi:hypothetical protein